jgi:hypothetical protein
LKEIRLDLNLYGDLAAYGGEEALNRFAHLKVSLKKGSLIRDLLARLGMPTEKRGITFINGKLSAMPGLQPDMDYVLKDNDRVAFFDLKSMWPFQYRHGVAMVDEMTKAVSRDKKKGLHTTYNKG